MKKRQPFAPKFLALSAALCVAPLALAQEAPPQDAQAAEAAANPPQQAASASWSTLDADGNGSLNRAEAAAVPSLAQIFDAADTDKNGELTAEEYRTFLETKEGGQGKQDGG